MFTVYIIFSNSKNIKYTGHTDNIERRLQEHNEGLLGRFTKNKGPWEVKYTKEFNTRAEAMEYEKYLKTGKGTDFIKREIGI